MVALFAGLSIHPDSYGIIHALILFHCDVAWPNEVAVSMSLSWASDGAGNNLCQPHKMIIENRFIIFLGNC